MNEIKKTLAENLHKNRKRLGLTQVKIADQIGVKSNTYANWEHKVAVPSIKHLVNLSKCFGITLDELVGIDSEPKF